MSHFEQFVERLAESDRAIDASDVALVYAHPYDEIVGCAGQLFRLGSALLTVTTDRSPENPTNSALAPRADAGHTDHDTTACQSWLSCH